MSEFFGFAAFWAALGLLFDWTEPQYDQWVYGLLVLCLVLAAIVAMVEKIADSKVTAAEVRAKSDERIAASRMGQYDGGRPT